MRKILFILCLLYAGFSFGQNDDPVLFSIGKDDVHVSEFRYIYEKNNADNADYSEASLNEYLDLYKKFKLKVHKAREIGLDTVQSLQKELEGYRKQLANSYLKDKEISDRLITEVMNRMKEDRKVSHIFVALDKKGTAAKQTEAKEKIEGIYAKLRNNNGVGFGEMAKTLSEDKVSAKKSGVLGYYTAPLPDGFYEFENAMYNTKKGDFSKPFQSKMGYHIIKVTDIRPARGEMEIAHILVRKKEQNKALTDAKKKVDYIHQQLDSGMAFEKAAAEYSADAKTKDRGGYLGFFGVNQYEKTFEDAAFALTEDNSYTAPVETKVGYHIIKRVSKRSNADENRTKKRIEARIKNNDRFAIAQKKLLEDVKNDADFNENKNLLKKFSDALDESFYSYKWELPSFKEKKALFNLANKKFTLDDFTVWAKGNVRERLKFPKNTPLKTATDKMYELYVDETVMAYEEANLENKYPDFKSLMREYREGILLFEITKNEVWDKASQDTVGLKTFFGNNRESYKWPERLEVNKVNITANNPAQLDEAYKLGTKKGADKLIEKYQNISAVTITISDDFKEVLDDEVRALKHKPGEHTGLFSEGNSGYYYIFKSLKKPSHKTLKEARGYVIADYQDHLENEWVTALKKKTPVKVNDKVVQSLIKK